MRVLYCTDTYAPQVNGVSVVTALSAAGVSRRGWTCAVVAPRYPAAADARVLDEPEAPALLRTAIPSVAFPPYPDIRLSAPAADAVAAAFDRFAPSLVHAQTEFVIGWLGAREARRRGIPLVTSYHTDFARYMRAWRLPWLAPVVESHLARFHRRARRTLTPSAPSRDVLRRLGVPHAEVWGRGVDTACYHPGRRSLALRDHLGLGTAFTFGYVGRLAPEKNVHFLLEAFRRLQRHVPQGSVRLVIAGQGPAEARLRAAAPPHTIFLGYLDRTKDLPALYASLDAFVFASVTETLGLVVLEAMASGLPVVAAPAGGVADHLRDRVNGLTFTAGDLASACGALRTLVADRALRIRLADGARRTAASLGWEEELDRLDAIYREVSGLPAPRSKPGDGARAADGHDSAA